MRERGGKAMERKAEEYILRTVTESFENDEVTTKKRSNS
jgi:hypothetical protein